KMLKRHPYPEMEMVYQVHRGHIFLAKGDLEKAEVQIQVGQNECERLGLRYWYPAILHHGMLVKTCLGKYKEVEELGQYILQLAAAQENSIPAGVALLYLGRNCYFQSDNHSARDYFRKSRRALSSPGASSPVNLHLIGILRGFLWNPNERDETILKDLQDSLEHYSSQSSWRAVEAHFALALIYFQKKDRKKTVEHLHSGFKIAGEKACTQFSFISPGDLVKVCGLAIELLDKEDGAFAEKLLITRLAHLAGPELERLSRHFAPHIRGKSKKIRIVLHQMTLPLLKIETLGRFKVIRSGSPLKEEEWHGSQTKNLLKVILCQGEKGIHKEALMENLWPEGRPETAEKNFKSALNRLRQVLEPGLDPEYSYSYVRLKDNRIFLDQEICEVDVENFLTLIKEGDKKEKLSQIKEALSAYKEAVDLFQGDFLPDDTIAEWADFKRQDLRQKYLGLLFRMARIYENRGNAYKAISLYKKAVGFDPLAEEAYQRLMTLYVDTGRRNEAIKIFRACEKALGAELNTCPEELTLSLYKTAASLK
ncbi:MAG: bacterial transcriptional activator domain-containing protein, partial [Thermodesulfobacteriota bacterium]